MFLLIYHCINHIELSLLIGSYIYLVILSIYQGSLLSLVIPLDLFFFQKKIQQQVSIPIEKKKQEIIEDDKLTPLNSKENVFIPSKKESIPYSQCSLGIQDVLEFTKNNLGLNYINVSCRN